MPFFARLFSKEVKKMKVCGIVCEYNPFHNGHLLHIEQTKKALDCKIVCVMSGCFVQRGDFAIMHKRARAEAAVKCGADLVIELPSPWSIASAEKFAYGAVSILNSLGGITHLSFGAESGDISILQKCAELLCDESFDEKLLSYYSEGVSYATARSRAIADLSKNAAAALSSPNNLLGIEYLKALIKLNSPIQPFIVTRTGANHDSDECTSGVASASLIRSRLELNQHISELVPQKSFEIINRESVAGHTLIDSSEISRAVLAALKSYSVEDFKKYGDISEGLEHRLYDAVSSSVSLSEAISKAKTKRYAHSRIRRCLLNAYLGIESNVSNGEIPYARVLAFNNDGRNILKTLKKSSQIDIITKPSSVKYKSEKALALLTLERKVDDIYSLFMKNPIDQGSTFKKSPIFIDNI